MVIKLVAEALRVVLFATRPVSDVVLSITYRLLMGEMKLLPPIENKILLMSATQLAKKIRQREIKCEDVVQAYIDRARAVHPYINAINDERFNDALNDAKKVDVFLKSNVSPKEIIHKTPLLGVPFSCKESLGIKGLAQTKGLLSQKHRKAEMDSDAVVLYKKAGAIPMNVTNVSEMMMWWEGSNKPFGILKNPYDNTRTVGGSSGGEASLITSAGAVIGIGTDIGGSIRIPASFCGIYGHKPSGEVVSNHRDFFDNAEEEESVKPISCTGPMCRYAEDLPLLMNLLSENKISFDREVDFRNVKVYVMEQFPGLLLSPIPDIKRAVKKAACYFKEKFNSEVVSLSLDELAYAFEIMLVKFVQYRPVPLKETIFEENGPVNLYWELLKSVFGRSKHSIPLIYSSIMEKNEKDEHYHKVQQIFDELQKKIEQIFCVDAIILLPTHPEIAPHHLMTIPKLQNTAYTSIFNSLGLPVTQIPAGMHKGLPFGIQAVSGKYQDHLTIATAIELDKLFGGWKSPCPVNTK